MPDCNTMGDGAATPAARSGMQNRRDRRRLPWQTVAIHMSKGDENLIFLTTIGICANTGILRDDTESLRCHLSDASHAFFPLNESTPMFPVSSVRNSPSNSQRWFLPALAILLVQIALYLWMAPRGFEFTDESYYYHNFLHWREFTGTVTFFGAYFEWPFRALGTSITAIRIFSLVLVLVCGAVLMHSVLRFSFQELPGRHGGLNMKAPGSWPYLVAPMASTMLYFGYLTTLRAPSYNLLSLCAMALATACLLRLVEPQAEAARARAAPFLYGLALGACLMAKATTAAMLVIAHLAFFFAVARTTPPKRFIEIFLLATLGVAVNVAVLTVQFPDWSNSLREGLNIMGMGSGHGVRDMLKGLSWDMQRMLLQAGPWLVAAGLLFALARRKLRASSHRAISLLALVLIAASMAIMASDHRTQLWLVAMAATAGGLHSLTLLATKGDAMTRWGRRDLALICLLLVLPLAFSFGTNMPVLGHSAIASVFAYCAVYLPLYRLWRHGMLMPTTFSIGLCLLCLPALVMQIMALTEVRYTYRQLAAQWEQNVRVTVGPSANALWVDARTSESLQKIAGLARTAGFKPGQHVLDLSGDSPGVIYAMGGNPLGTPWMMGGYPASTAMAERVIEKVDPASLRSAWLLTSSNNPRRIKGWEPILASRVGPGSHQLAASIMIDSPYLWNPTSSRSVSVELWRPAEAAP